MKVRITHLKAPWPSGAVVGDVLEVRAVPAWAIGKCEPEPDDSEVTLALPEVLAPDTLEDQAQAMAQHFHAQAQQAIALADEAHALVQSELQALLTKAQGDNSELQSLLKISEAKVAELQAKAMAEAEKQAAEELALKEAKDNTTGKKK